MDLFFVPDPENAWLAVGQSDGVRRQFREQLFAGAMCIQRFHELVKRQDRVHCLFLVFFQCLQLSQQARKKHNHQIDQNEHQDQLGIFQDQVAKSDLLGLNR